MKFLTKPKILIFILVLMLIFASIAMYVCKPSINTGNGEVSYSDASAKESASDVSLTDTVVSESEPEIEPEPLPPDTVTIQMGGDVLLHDSVVKASKTGKNSYGHIPSYLSLFKDVFVADINIVNLEGPTDAKGKNTDVKGFPVFNMPYEILTSLKSINVDVCVTANNHTCDMGFTGVKNTYNNVKKAGMIPVGSYAAEEDSKKCCIIEENGIKVGIIAFASYTEGSVKSDKKFCVDKCGKTEESTLNAVKPAIDELKENGAEFIVVSLHWGEEYKDAPSGTQKKIAAELCSYGADVIMGSHSHCVQPIEVLTVDRGGRESKALVIYSLGNLFTNQTGLKKAKTQEGMVVSVKAVRGEDGIVRLEDAFYMPTYTYVRGNKGKNFMRLMPAGKYAFMEEKPSFFKDNSAWKKCKNAWNNVNKTVGNAIESVKAPSDYPVGFFDVSSSDI